MVVVPSALHNQSRVIVVSHVKCDWPRHGKRAHRPQPSSPLVSPPRVTSLSPSPCYISVTSALHVSSRSKRRRKDVGATAATVAVPESQPVSDECVSRHVVVIAERHVYSICLFRLN